MIRAIVLCLVIGGVPAVAGAANAVATFAGGCFWCTEADFEKLPGVISAVSGYTGGEAENPRYEDVSAGSTGHAEAVEVTFDPAQISYEQLLEHYWHSVDPFTPAAQFCDHGDQYRTAIFFHDPAQRAAALRSKQALQKSGRFTRPIVTQIVPAGRFYRAEDYHQDYYRKNPLRYNYYRFACGRDAALEKIWGPKRP